MLNSKKQKSTSVTIYLCTEYFNIMYIIIWDILEGNAKEPNNKVNLHKSEKKNTTSTGEISCLFYTFALRLMYMEV